MATSVVSARAPIPLGVSTKGLNCDDPIAKLIQPYFVDLVFPRHLILYLPPGLLTASDEDRVVARQDSMGREEAAKLLLVLLSQRNDWIPRLQQGLRHREIRLEHLADRIDDLQRNVPMEVDLADVSMGGHQAMEVDAEPLPQSAELSHRMRELVAGRGLGELNEQDLNEYRNLVLTEIARQFFTRMAHTVKDVEILTDCFDRIMTAFTTEFAIGCLELRLRIRTSRDLHELRRLVESGILLETAERALLTKERRDWLEAKAASYGLKWRQVRLKVSIRKEDLDRCETFLKVKEEWADAKSPAEASLLKHAAKKGEEDVLEHHAQHLPKLLLSFLDWLLLEHSDLAGRVAPILATSPLDIGITETMATCRQFFGLSNEHEKDLADVTLEMTRSAEGAWAKPAESSPGTQTEDESGSPPTTSKLYVEAPPQSLLAKTVGRLTEAELMTPLQVPNMINTYSFSSSFVADFAMTCGAESSRIPLTDYVSRAHKFGSPFVMLHLVDFLLSLSLPVERFASGLRAHERFGRSHKKQSKQMIDKILMSGAHELLRSVSNNDLPLVVVELYMACYKYIKSPDIGPLYKRCWNIFGPEWKSLTRDLLTSGRSGTLPHIQLLTLSGDERRGVVETMEMVLSARHTVDLTGKLAYLSKAQLTAILACLQLTNVAKFEITNDTDYTMLRIVPDSQEDVAPPTVGQPALKLCENVLDDKVVDCLLDAMPGLESVSHFDLTGCTVSPHNLQRLLDSMHVKSVQTLALNRISFSDSKGRFLPRFSRLRRLQAVELDFLVLQDEQMPELAEQLQALPDLRELTLEHNPITTAGLSQLAPALASRDSLRVLHLPRCQLDAGAAFVLGALLTSARNLHVLNLSHCRLLDSGLQHLSLVLTKHTQLCKVSLRGGGYSPHGLAVFLAHLAKCSRMQYLEIGQCPLEEDGVEVSDKLLKALAGSSQWDYLGLWQCRIGRTSFLERLATLRIQLRGLTTLVLQDNDLDDAKLGHLAEAVRGGVFRYLSHLNLRQNSIGKAGAERLGETLPLLPRLTELLLQNTGIPASAAVALSCVVLRLPDMKLLDLSDSYAMGPDDVSEVIDKIEEVVQAENVLVGDGVGFAGNDALMEREFARDKLHLLGFVDRIEVERWSPDDTFYKPIVYGEGESTLIVDLPYLAAGSSELRVGVAGVRRRQLTERHGDDVIIDGVLRISLGHNLGEW